MLISEDSEFATRMRAERVLRHQLIRDFYGQLVIDATLDIYLRQLLPLEPDILAELFALTREIGMFCIGLRADGNVFTGRHRHRAGNKPRHAGQENLARLGRRGGNANDQACVETMPSLAPRTAANLTIREFEVDHSLPNTLLLAGSTT